MREQRPQDDPGCRLTDAADPIDVGTLPARLLMGVGRGEPYAGNPDELPDWPADACSPDVQEWRPASAGGVTASLTSKGIDEPPSPDEPLLNEQVDADIAERLAAVHFGDELAGEGTATVSLDAEGRFVEHHPDGRTAVVGRLSSSGAAGGSPDDHGSGGSADASHGR